MSDCLASIRNCRGGDHLYYLLALGSLLLAALPRSVADRLARTIGWCCYHVLRLRRPLVEKNIELAFGPADADRGRLVRRSYQEFAKTAIEFLRGYRRDLCQNITLRGEENITTALAEGRGVYILCFHLGNWEALGAAVNRLIGPAGVVVKPVGSQEVNRFVTEVRRKNGFLVIDRSGPGAGYRAIRTTIKTGKMVGFVMDQSRPGEPRLPFFGHPAKTNTGLAKIWAKNPAPIVPAYITRSSFERHTVTFKPALDMVGLPTFSINSITSQSTGETPRFLSGDLEPHLIHSAYFNTIIAECIRQAPEQYLWLHNRWK